MGVPEKINKIKDDMDLFVALYNDLKKENEELKDYIIELQKERDELSKENVRLWEELDWRKGEAEALGRELDEYTD